MICNYIFLLYFTTHHPKWLPLYWIHWDRRISFRYNLAARLCEYEKHQQKYFNYSAAIRNARKLQLEHRIATKYVLLLFAQTLATLIANPFYERKFILRSRTTTGISNCAIDIQQDLINYTGFVRDDPHFM